MLHALKLKENSLTNYAAVDFQTSNSQGVKIILMSATLNADQLLSYYSWPLYVNGPLEQQGCKFDVPGSLNHNVAVFYLDDVRLKSFTFHILLRLI